MGRYEIQVREQLTERRCRTFEPLEVRHLADGSTLLVVLVPDQAALHALISHVRDLGVELIGLRRLDAESA